MARGASREVQDLRGELDEVRLLAEALQARTARLETEVESLHAYIAEYRAAQASTARQDRRAARLARRTR